MRVRKSAIGSVIMGELFLPRGLDQPRNLAFQGELAQTDAAHAKATEKSSRATA
jgi:hypothetical protein